MQTPAHIKLLPLLSSFPAATFFSAQNCRALEPTEVLVPPKLKWQMALIGAPLYLPFKPVKNFNKTLEKK